jgi:CO dehydrogenase maturation factor
MNVAIVGKGGCGKTSISGTMARLLARRGHDVLAIDGDPNPNLALTLGIPVERIETLPTLPSDLVERTEDGFRPTRTLDEVCSSHAVEGSDGVRLLVMAYPRRADTG